MVRTGEMADILDRRIPSQSTSTDILTQFDLIGCLNLS
jgi:hypothetical protein